MTGAVEVRGSTTGPIIVSVPRVKKTFVPDIRQVTDTHRTWPEFKVEIGSGPVIEEVPWIFPRGGVLPRLITHINPASKIQVIV
ncbi:hypothetical protein Prudu_011915 [Prunus dulcis]|uniref:Uncharacterized protein n=1 Tax=Prunus dulcis TaxID=3755 RepID=A0A4Y1RCA2_PRUDU|nr:hypothetical protein Prudu_011915 [Prunus dulcis]